MAERDQEQASAPRSQDATYAEEKAFEQRRAGLLPANANADAKVLGTRKRRLEALAAELKARAEARRARAGM